MAVADDKIERLSQEDSIEEFGDDDVAQTTSRVYLTTMDTSYMAQESHPEGEHQKGVAKVVACVAVTFILICFLMVGASLFMSKNIDNRVRSSNEMLRKHNDRMAEYLAEPTVNVTSSL